MLGGLWGNKEKKHAHYKFRVAQTQIKWMNEKTYILIWDQKIVIIKKQLSR